MMPDEGPSFDELMSQERYEEALALAEELVRGASKSDDRKAQAEALIDEAVVLAVLRRFHDSQMLLEKAKQLAPRIAKSYKDDSQYKYAVKYAQYFQPRKGVDYRSACDYARTEYHNLDQTGEYLDGKAGSLINYVSAFSGVIVVAFTYQALTSYWIIGAAALVPFCFALRAIGQAAKARSPMLQPSPAPAEEVIRYAESSGLKALGWLAMQFWAASEGMMVVIKMKSKLIQSATTWFYWGVFTLLLPVGCSIGVALLDC